MRPHFERVQKGKTPLWGAQSPRRALRSATRSSTTARAAHSANGIGQIIRRRGAAAGLRRHRMLRHAVTIKAPVQCR